MDLSKLSLLELITLNVQISSEIWIRIWWIVLIIIIVSFIVFKWLKK